MVKEKIARVDVAVNDSFRVNETESLDSLV